MTVRWTFRKVLNSVFGPTIFRGKCMHPVHIGYDGHDQIQPGDGCNECGWIRLPEPRHQPTRRTP